VLILLKTSRDSVDPSTRPLWHDLTPGSYGCGFKSLWKLDYGRTYNIVFADDTPYAEGKSPRPILINLWYPTASRTARPAMAYGDYLQILVENTPLARFSAELVRYTRAVIAREVFGKEEDTFTLAEQAAFQVLLDTRTAARRDAPAAKGRFPVVLYHAGYGSSFEDNSVLCEYLASHGYVVVGSAFQEVAGTSLDIEGKVRTAGDIRFLLSYVQGLSFTDWNHVGMVGHSGGAHAAIIYQTEPGCAVDATVSLDTTEDYYSLAYPGWQRMRDPVKATRATLTRPILFAAKPWAGFEMAETMTATPRYLLTVDGLHHEDFVTQGSLGRWMKLRLASEQGRKDAETYAHLGWNRYEVLCRTVLDFFDAVLKGQTAALDARTARDREQSFRENRPHLEYLPVGTADPEPYTASLSSVPSPRQVRYLLRTEGAETAIAVLRESWRPETDAPAYNSQFTVGLICQLISEGKVAEATALFQFLSGIGRSPAPFLFRDQSDPKSKLLLEYLLAVDPANMEAANELKRIEGSVPNASPDP
jgi:hypothetical protein